MLTGENGILNRATEAKQTNEQKTAEEELRLGISALTIDYRKNTTNAKSFRGYVMDNQQALANAMGVNTNELTMNSESYSVTYRGQVYIISENGGLEPFRLIELTGFNIKETSLEVPEGNTIKLTIENKTPSDANEQIVWESSNTAVATVDSEGNVTGVKTGSETATITAKSISEGATSSKSCVVTVTPSPYIDSSYVQYNVAYTDVYTGTEYKSNTGWRLLTKIEDDTEHYDAQAGTYTGNINIISTGIPAGLRYNYSTITSASWAGNEQQRKDYLDTTITDRTIGGYNYPSCSYTDKNIYAASGLLRNFGSIVFSKAVSVNSLSLDDGIGGFVAVSNNGTVLQASNSPTGENLFKVAKTNLASGEVTNIRSVNLWDIKGTNDDSNLTQIDSLTDKRAGLFRLDNYTPDQHDSTYWIASPKDDSNDGIALRFVRSTGYVGNSGIYDYGVYGIRPVISITGVKMQLNGNVWQIVANFDN